jgi:hypothetical protein
MNSRSPISAAIFMSGNAARMRKYKRYAGRKTQAGRMIAATAIKRPRLFVHWHQSKAGTFA